MATSDTSIAQPEQHKDLFCRLFEVGFNAGEAAIVDELLALIDICRFKDGAIARHWGVLDRLGLLEQVGDGHRPPQVPC